jgi:hypothetical protein
MGHSADFRNPSDSGGIARAMHYEVNRVRDCGNQEVSSDVRPGKKWKRLKF